jgi:hypothetical protein
VVALGTLLSFAAVLLATPSCDGGSEGLPPGPRTSLPQSSPALPSMPSPQLTPSLPPPPGSESASSTPPAQPAPATAPAGATPQETGSCGSGALPAGLAGLGVLLTAGTAVAILLASMGLPQPGPQMAVPATPSSPVVAPVGDARAVEERRRLAEALVHVQPSLPEGLAFQVGQTLASVGLDVIAPAPGAVFDPALHSALGVEQTADVALVDRIARTLRPGYLDGPHVVTFAQVVVYASAPAESVP